MRTSSHNYFLPVEMTTEETLELIHIQWITDRSVKVRIRQSVMTFSTWNTKKNKTKNFTAVSKYNGKEFMKHLVDSKLRVVETVSQSERRFHATQKKIRNDPCLNLRSKGAARSGWHKPRISIVNKWIPHVHHWMVLFKKLLVVLNSTTPSCSAP